MIAIALAGRRAEPAARTAVVLRVVVLGHGETMMLKFASSVASNSVVDVLSCSDQVAAPSGTVDRREARRGATGPTAAGGPSSAPEVEKPRAA
jgi:hypothetical protein